MANRIWSMVERIERKDTNSVKYSPKAVEGLCGNPNAEPFWVADMDFAAPKEAREALMETAQLGLYGYPAFDDLDEVFVDWVRKRHSCTLSTDNVVVSPGILASIAAMTELFPQRDVIIPRPAYRPFVDIASRHGRTIHDWPLVYEREGGLYGLDFAALEEIASRPGRKILYFCSPHNPTGRVWTEDELEATARICDKHGIAVFCDEIHCDLTYRSQHHIPFFEIAKGRGLDCVVFMAPSKTFNIAGEHFSATVFTDTKLRDLFKEHLERMRMAEISLFSGTAARACYLNGYNWLMELTQCLEDNARRMRVFLSEELPQIRFATPQASFVTFLDCSEVLAMLRDRHIDMDLVTFFGKEASVAMNAGPWFGEGYDGFLRFNLGTDWLHIEGALKRMKAAVEKLGRI